MTGRRGPVEDLKWTDKLQASVSTPAPMPRIHGYDVRGEMLGISSFAETMFLSLTGELPSPDTLMAFEAVLVFLAPVSVAEAAGHASLLAGLCGSGSGGLTGVSAIALAERSRNMVNEYMPLAEAALGGKDLPASEGAEETRLLLKALREAEVSYPGKLEQLPPPAACMAVLMECCGIRNRRIMETVITLAGLPCTLAEGMAAKPGNFRTYPIGLPEYEYDDRRT